MYHEVGISSWFRNVAQWFLILFDISFHQKITEVVSTGSSCRNEGSVK